MALNTLFPRQREMINYDYFDIAEGVGYVIYFGLIGDNAENIISTSSSIYSENICSHESGLNNVPGILYFQLRNHI